jgi:HSP20 family protein
MADQIPAETALAGYVAPILKVIGGRSRLTRKLLSSPNRAELPPLPSWSPSINVFDTGRAFVVIAELAGVGPDSLRIELDAAGDTLTLRGTRTSPTPGQSVGEEISSGTFERSISLDEPVDPHGARAICRYGLLELMIPKHPKRVWKGVEGGGGGIRTPDTLAGIAV